MTKWGQKHWGTFYWGLDTLLVEMEKKTGTKPVIRVQITIESTTTDITSYLLNGVSFDSEKNKTPDKNSVLTAGDIMLTFSNYNDLFTEEDSSSIFYNKIYHGSKIDIDFGLKLEDGTIEYEHQAILEVIDVYCNSDDSTCYIVARDKIYKIVKFIANITSRNLVPKANNANIGNGYITEIQTKPFVMVNENWTLTCTVGGGSGVATFSVIGSVSGNIGTATSNTEFSNASSGGIKFTIFAGGTNWNIGDILTFTTRKHPQWTNTNPIKIIWSLLTGYNYDTDTIEDWYDATPQLDHTQSTSNADINYTSFQTSISDLGSDFNLSGYVKYNISLSTVLEEILLHFIGYIFSDGESKINIKISNLLLTSLDTLREFSSSKKITTLKIDRNIDNIINSVTVKYKKTATWAWSGAAETTDGKYTAQNINSINQFGEKNYNLETHWLSIDEYAIKWASDMIISKFSDPYIDAEFNTGLDALKTLPGDIIKLTDTKLQLNNRLCEVYKLSKDFSSRPIKIRISAYELSDKWQALTNSSISTNGFSGCMSCAKNGYVYSLEAGTKKLHRYDITNDTWSEMTANSTADGNWEYEGTCIINGDGNYIYALMGGNYANNFHRYDVSSDTWTLMDSPGYPVCGGSGMVYDTNGHIFLFFNHASNYAAMMKQYDIDIDNWGNVGTPLYFYSQHNRYASPVLVNGYIWFLSAQYYPPLIHLNRTSVAGLLSGSNGAESIWNLEGLTPANGCGMALITYKNINYLYFSLGNGAPGGRIMTRYNVATNLWDYPFKYPEEQINTDGGFCTYGNYIFGRFNSNFYKYYYKK